jgi:hypothetical protein
VLFNAAYVGCCLPTFLDSLSFLSSRVKQFLKMGTISCHETSVNNYQLTLPDNPEEENPDVAKY